MTTIIPQISELSNSISKISLNLHSITSKFNMIELLNPIPYDIQSLLSNYEFKELVNQTLSATDSLHTYLNSFNPELKRAIYKQNYKSKTQPYAGFKVDEMPILHYHVSDQPKQIQMTFDEYNQAHIEEYCHEITPIKEGQS